MRTIEVELIEHFDDNGRPHNETGPASALMAKDGSGPVLQIWRLNGVLHRLDGPAIVLPPADVAPVLDGKPIKAELVVEGTCWYRGRNVPEHWVAARPSLEEIRRTEDQDLKAAAIAYYGLREYIKDIGARLLDSDLGDRIAARELYDVPGLPYRVLICTDGSSGRIYDIAVPATCKNCRDAGAALNGFSDDQLADES